MSPSAAHHALFPSPAPPPAPSPAVQAIADLMARRVVAIHWTLFTPGIPITAGLADPCRWATLYGATPPQAMRHVLERLDRKPWDLSIRDNPAGELTVYLADPAEPLAIITEGLTLAEARMALDALRRAHVSERVRA